MRVQFEVELKAMAADLNCSLREAAIYLCRMYYWFKGYSIQAASDYIGNPDAESLFDLVEKIMEEREFGNE